MISNSFIGNNTIHAHRAFSLRSLVSIVGWWISILYSVPSVGDELEGDLWTHFRRDDYRTPVMFDDGIMAYVINGIATRVNADGSKTTMVLRFDPHAK
jgi:hypothetical protein